ncbi:MAG TPA: hypothetical protein VHB97_24180 [Polyangia bacterium]|nr:hypothetical protein [Polyangia bacterium]
MTKATRYDAVIATLVGVLALMVSGYTAYVQRQQVRAQVWPYLSVYNSNVPNIRLEIANKGVGPAIIKNAIVRVDGKPVPDWNTVIERLLGKKHNRIISSFGQRVLAPGEAVAVLDLRDEKGEPVSATDKDGADAFLWKALNERVTPEICYCSTLDECWIVDGDSGTRPTQRCAKPSADSFRN